MLFALDADLDVVVDVLVAVVVARQAERLVEARGHTLQTRADCYPVGVAISQCYSVEEFNDVSIDQCVPGVGIVGELIVSA